MALEEAKRAMSCINGHSILFCVLYLFIYSAKKTICFIIQAFMALRLICMDIAISPTAYCLLAILVCCLLQQTTKLTTLYQVSP